jgi:hypothetical protein
MCKTDREDKVKRRWLPVPLPTVDEDEEVDSKVNIILQTWLLLV